MTKPTAKCRICEKDFVPCKKCFRVTGVFNWREMCCSEQCGKQYLFEVEKARNPIAKLNLDSEAIALEIQENSIEDKVDVVADTDVTNNTKVKSKRSKSKTN